MYNFVLQFTVRHNYLCFHCENLLLKTTYSAPFPFPSNNVIFFAPISQGIRSARCDKEEEGGGNKKEKKKTRTKRTGKTQTNTNILANIETKMNKLFLSNSDNKNIVINYFIDHNGLAVKKE